MWIRTTTTTHQPSTIADDGVYYFAVTPTATNIVRGDVPVDAHKRMHGVIEHIMINSKQTTAALAFDLAFFSGATYAETIGSDDRLIDFESFVSGDFMQIGTGLKYAAKSDLALPYFDRDATKKFYMGLINRSGTALDPKMVTIEFSWRADLGEP